MFTKYLFERYVGFCRAEYQSQKDAKLSLQTANVMFLDLTVAFSFNLTPLNIKPVGWGWGKHAQTH